MKNKFLLGLISGVLSCVLIFGIAACSAGDSGNGLTSVKPSSTPTGDSTLEKLESIAYQKKIEQLASILDYYYMDDIDAAQVAEGIYAGMVQSLGDVYTTYYTAEEYAAFMESSSGKYAGLGALVTTNADGNVEIVKPFANGPAAKAGILPGDVVVEVDGENIVGMDLTEAITMIKGEPGTEVNLKIYREGMTEYMELTVTREFIEVPTVEYQMLDDKIGYIYVMEFDEVTEEQFIAAVDDLEEQGMKGLVIDLRDNPGGLLSTVCGMLSRLVPKGDLLVYTEDKYGHREENASTSDKNLEVPLAVLINGNSASASEVFSGAVQDYEIGKLVGTQSFGKGIVQSIIPLGDGSAVKVTISKYYTPNGRNIHKTGLTPDIPVELDEDLKGMASIPIEQDNQIQAAVDYLLGR